MPVTDYSLPIDRANTPAMWGEVADLTNAVVWKAINEELSQPFAAGTVGGVSLNGLILFGFGVCSKGTSVDGVGYPTAIADVFQGIVLATDALEQRLGYTLDNANRMGYPPRATGAPGQQSFSSSAVSIIRRAGRIAVPIETAVNANDPVHMRCLTVGGTGNVVARGAFRNAADGTTTQLITRARWLTTVAAPAANTLGVGYLTLEGTI